MERHTQYEEASANQAGENAHWSTLGHLILEDTVKNAYNESKTPNRPLNSSGG